MPVILVAGSGHIGRAIAQILTQAPTDYQVVLADIAEQPPAQVTFTDRLRYISVDVQNTQQMTAAVQQYRVQALVSCLPYFLTLNIAELAQSLRLHYFDLTEDRAMTTAIGQLAQGADTAFVPQCGVAPGFINVIANHLMQRFQELDTVKLRCGALPQQANNALQYALTWSIDGLINEYGNPCAAIAQHQPVLLSPLSDLETVQLDGATYEAFNTSGGLGTLAEKYAGKAAALNYKTLRYPGHCEKMLFLMNELKLNEDRDTLKKILLTALPRTEQDVVVVGVTVQGFQNHELVEENYWRKFYPATLNGQVFTAIQMTTACSACVAIDMVLKNPQQYRGFIPQAQFNLEEFLANRFGEYLRHE